MQYKALAWTAATMDPEERTQEARPVCGTALMACAARPDWTLTYSMGGQISPSDDDIRALFACYRHVHRLSSEIAVTGPSGYVVLTPYKGV